MPCKLNTNFGCFFGSFIAPLMFCKSGMKSRRFFPLHCQSNALEVDTNFGHFFGCFIGALTFCKSGTQSGHFFSCPIGAMPLQLNTNVEHFFSFFVWSLPKFHTKPGHFFGYFVRALTFWKSGHSFGCIIRALTFSKLNEGCCFEDVAEEMFGLCIWHAERQRSEDGAEQMSRFLFKLLKVSASTMQPKNV